MIGNDIVDLALASKESNWKRKGFLDKIFTQKEQLQIFNAQNPTVMVWNLWSRKEAAYKIYNRQTNVRGYFPYIIECNDLLTSDGFTFGKVTIKDKIYFTKTEIKSDYIYSIALENKNDFDSIKTISTRKNITKENEIPVYIDADTKVVSLASVSHHGRFEKIITI